MIIIFERGTEYLVKDLERAFEQQSTERLVLFKAEQWVTPIKDWINTLGEHMIDIIEHDRSKFYLCEDGDAFLIAPALTRKKIAEIFDCMSPHRLANANPNDSIKLFELSSDIHQLLILAQDKLDILLDAEQALKQQKILEERLAFEKRERAILNMSITKDIKDQVAQKKKKRDTIDILLIDDDLFSLKMVDTLLNKHYKVYKSVSGWDAITHYIQHAPHIVFLDIDMPLINGHDILSKILEIDPEAYIIMLSGHSHQHNIVKAIQAGAKGFIAKPFTRDKLFHYILQAPPLYSKQKASPHV